MSDVYTFKVRGTCAGGGHITIKHFKNGEEYTLEI